MIYYKEHNSPIGKLNLVSDGSYLIGLYIKGQKYFLESINENIQKNDNLIIFKNTEDWLDKYFKGLKPDIKDLKLKLHGSDFRIMVWHILEGIPYGEVITYGEIAKKVAKIMGKKKMSSQAIGGAVSHNPISIIIPCHRVVGVNNSLVGYAGGVDIKKKLLDFEKNTK